MNQKNHTVTIPMEEYNELLAAEKTANELKGVFEIKPDNLNYQTIKNGFEKAILEDAKRSRDSRYDFNDPMVQGKLIQSTKFKIFMQLC